MGTRHCQQLFPSPFQGRYDEEVTDEYEASLGREHAISSKSSVTRLRRNRMQLERRPR